jgi:transposase
LGLLPPGRVAAAPNKKNGKPMSITPNFLAATSVPDSEVTLKPVRRTYTAMYKQAILLESETCAPGEIGAMLRREGLYSSHLSKWRSQRAQGVLAGLEPQARGPRPEPQRTEVAQLRQEIERLQLRVKQAEAIVEVQKKVSQLLGLMAISPDGTK